MKKIIVYQILWLFLLGVAVTGSYIYELPAWYLNNILYANCAYWGALGGVLYCLRAVYINKCYLKTWDKDWEVWYYLRPITSTISGFISSIFLKAGLLALQASSQDKGGSFGYLAVAFIAGYNVDNFLKKIETVVQASLGIEKSKSSDKSEQYKGE